MPEDKWVGSEGEMSGFLSPVDPAPLIQVREPGVLFPLLR
jgi:hypothetical protein